MEKTQRRNPPCYREKPFCWGSRGGIAAYKAAALASALVKQHAHELITRQEIIHLVENMKKTSPELVDEAFPNVVSYSLFQKILTSLLKEGVPH